MTSESHFIYLREAYSEVGDRTWSSEDFLESNLDASQKLFTPESMHASRPRPKELEVFALVSGLPFRAEFIDSLVKVQEQISSIIEDHLHYWVAPNNFGVEYCVFKWPLDSWNDEWLGVIKDVLVSIRQSCFQFNIGGVQINPDGCVVAKGFDTDAAIFKIREKLKLELPFLPKKQSGWSHVPLGRILEPLGPERFKKLAELMNTLYDMPIATTDIDSMKLIHEKRWYMEEKNILEEYPLSSVCEERSK